MSRETILDDAIAKAKEAEDRQLVEWLRMARGGESAARWYTEKLRDANRTIRKMLNENAKLRGDLEFERSENGWAREFLNRIGPKCGTKDCPSLVAYMTKLEDENAKLRELLRESLMDYKLYAKKYDLPPYFSDVNEHLDARLRELGIEVP